VQVFAGRDRRSAEELVARVQGAGFPVHLDAEPDGSGQLYKVRVGGYPTKERASEVAQSLSRDGFSAWVTSRR
jgi:cell division septation protein DedD